MDRRHSDLERMSREALLTIESSLQLLEEHHNVPVLDKYEMLVRSHCQLQLQQKYLNRTLASLQVDADNGVPLEKLYMAKLQELTSREDPFDCAIMRSYNEKRRNMTADMDDSDLVATQFTENYIDPITKRLIENPVKNSICHHMYDHNSIKELIQKNPRTRCPVVGCSNKQPIAVHHLVHDEDARLRLESMKMQNTGTPR